MWEEHGAFGPGEKQRQEDPILSSSRCPSGRERRDSGQHRRRGAGGRGRGKPAVPSSRVPMQYVSVSIILKRPLPHSERPPPPGHADPYGVNTNQTIDLTGGVKGTCLESHRALHPAAWAAGAFPVSFAPSAARTPELPGHMGGFAVRREREERRPAPFGDEAASWAGDGAVNILPPWPLPPHAALSYVL